MNNFSRSSHDHRLAVEDFLDEPFPFEQNGGTSAFQATQLEEKSMGLWGTLSNRKRPFPSTQMMVASLDASQKSPCPLIQDFLQKAGKSHLLKTKDTSTNIQNDDNGRKDEPKKEADLYAGAIDDCSFATLTEGQHRRYLRLSELGKQNSRPMEKKEFNKLRTLVEEEQTLYCKALLTFWGSQKDRLGLGFQEGDKAAILRNLATDMNLKLREWEELSLPLTFGKCSQVFSLLYPPVDQKLHRTSPLESIRREMLHASKSLGSVRLEDFLKPGSDLSSFEKVSKGSIPLFKDDRSLKLAQQHGADMVLSDTTLQLLLRIEEMGTWFLPAVRCSDERILLLGEPTITMFSNPRECIQVGLNEAVVQKQFSASSKSIQEVDYDYILWTLPSTNQRKRKILIRRRCVPLDVDTSMPLRVHMTTEYFPERGQEIVSNSDMALWMLDYILDPNSRVVHGKVDPKSATVVNYSDVNLAHALAANGSSVPATIKTDPTPCIVRWYNLLHLLAVLPTIGSGKHLLCYPGDAPTQSQGSCFSVHELQNNGRHSVLNLFAKSDQVRLGAPGFQRCYRPWDWQDSRVPYTFPYRKKFG